MRKLMASLGFRAVFIVPLRPPSRRCSLTERERTAQLASCSGADFDHRRRPRLRGAPHEPALARKPAFFCGARPASCCRARPKQCGLVELALAAGVAELVDAPDLGSGDESRGGSSPSARTISFAAGERPGPSDDWTTKGSRPSAAIMTRRNVRCR